MRETLGFFFLEFLEFLKKKIERISNSFRFWLIYLPARQIPCLNPDPKFDTRQERGGRGCRRGVGAAVCTINGV